MGSRARARVRTWAGATGSICNGVAAVVPEDDPTPFLLMVGVHLLAAEAYWTGLVCWPFFFEFDVFLVIFVAPCLSFI